MPSNSAKNFGYWRNRAREAENKVESQERLIDGQQKQIDELTNEAKNLREVIDQRGPKEVDHFLSEEEIRNANQGR